MPFFWNKIAPTPFVDQSTFTINVFKKSGLINIEAYNNLYFRVSNAI
jgi:hypothetical protein